MVRMMSRLSFDNTGREYNVSRILMPDGTLDVEGYKSYSPLFLSCVLCAARSGDSIS